MKIVGLDIGGANLKASDGQDRAVLIPFALWKAPDKLADELAQLLVPFDDCDAVAFTMTGELADCYPTKSNGVQEIIAAAESAAGNRRLVIYHLQDGLVDPGCVGENWISVAAANWHALARFAGQHLRQSDSDHSLWMLIDIGSTTTDVIPIRNAHPVTTGMDDVGRLQNSELVYTGLERTPISAIVRSVPYRGSSCPVATELFATSLDVNIILNGIEEQPGNCQTADDRPATRQYSISRLGRMICADRSQFDLRDAICVARYVHAQQLQMIADAVRTVLGRFPDETPRFVVGGQGEPLAIDVVQTIQGNAEIVRLSEILGPEQSRVAPAFAIARLAGQQLS